ncbi:WXG100 family type VII secretion target [Sinomonas cyclohexanicum]|nr:hypothetical protein [Corynebacterium cyclohexanicum]
MADWSRTQAQVEASLGSIGTALRNAGNAYGDIETSNSSLFRG